MLLQNHNNLHNAFQQRIMANKNSPAHARCGDNISGRFGWIRTLKKIKLERPFNPSANVS
jgi:hypothetical protein